eukprot:COSAG05_NODE_12648_length_459_cov_112.250000_1_plen_85_part_01
MGWFAPVGVKSRYLLAFCYLSIALALLYHLCTVVFAYFTGTCEGARACTTSIPATFPARSSLYVTAVQRPDLSPQPAVGHSSGMP